MAPIVFLASYPRSGNTFLRALLANYVSGRNRPLSVAEIAAYGSGEKNEAVWRAVTGAPPQRRTLELEWRSRAAYLALTRDRPAKGPVMFKTHTVNGLGFGAPAFDIRPGDRAVYIVRHPLDVLVSASHFFGLSMPATAERMLTPGAYNDSGGVAPFETTGSWMENVAGWINETRCPVLLLRYRDLCRDTGKQLKRVLQFIGAPVLDERIAMALEFSAFDHLRRSQMTEGFDQGPAKNPRATFFRNGQTDQWKTQAPAELAAKLDGELGPWMEALGFERPSAIRSTIEGSEAWSPSQQALQRA